MKTTSLFKACFLLALSGTAVLLSNCSQPAEMRETKSEVENPGDLMDTKSDIERGAYLVTISGCDDCHSPKIMTPQGPVIDSTRRLSGHPEGSKMPVYDLADLQPGKWILATQDLTAWVGLWGVSFPYNLTPDKETGTGTWTPDLFIRILRSGKHMGAESARPILPPMPWQNFAKMTDEDLGAIFAYLQSLPPIRNKVPDPLPPPGM